jgi:hypothetical protein
MSIERCDRCESTVDTDKDADCYVELGNKRRLHKTVCMCQRCRERHWHEIEYQETA